MRGIDTKVGHQELRKIAKFASQVDGELQILLKLENLSNAFRGNRLRQTAH